jgi:hypothetical protein
MNILAAMLMFLVTIGPNGSFGFEKQGQASKVENVELNW